MNGIKLNINHSDAEKIAEYIKNIAGNVSPSDIVEIVLKTNAFQKEKEERPKVTITSREIADALGRPHTVVVKQIAKYLCEGKKEGDANGFILTSFVCSHKNKKSYPMYELTEDACKEYRNLVQEYGGGIKSVTDGLRRFDQAVAEKFHPGKWNSKGIVGNGFLLEGRPRSEYEKYCNMFNEFITGPAVEGREIAELTEKFQKFHDVINATPLKAQESNELEFALYDVAIEAEMQGFIYGFKMFDALLNEKLAPAV